MNRIINFFDFTDNNPIIKSDWNELTRQGRGIASRFSDHKVNMEDFKIFSTFESGGTTLDLKIGYISCGQLDYTRWHIGGQDVFGVLFEDGHKEMFKKNDYADTYAFKKAIYNFFKNYIDNGFNLSPRFEIYDGPDCLEI